jgi:proteasome inhibitor subunit 1 (PI31)
MDVLDPSALLASIPKLLPEGQKTLASPQDALVVLFHAAMASLAFRLVGLDDSSSSRGFAENVLPIGWNKTGPDSYTLRYKHDQSSLVFLLKLVKLSTRSLIHGIAIEVGSSTPSSINN